MKPEEVDNLCYALLIGSPGAVKGNYFSITVFKKLIDFGGRK